LFNAAANAPASSGLAEALAPGGVVALARSSGGGAGAGATGAGAAGGAGFAAWSSAMPAAAGRLGGASVCEELSCPASAESRIHETLVTINAAAITTGAITLLPLRRR
jgi:hypothetical protein